MSRGGKEGNNALTKVNRLSDLHTIEICSFVKRIVYGMSDSRDHDGVKLLGDVRVLSLSFFTTKVSFFFLFRRIYRIQIKIIICTTP